MIILQSLSWLTVAIITMLNPDGTYLVGRKEERDLGDRWLTRSRFLPLKVHNDLLYQSRSPGTIACKEVQCCILYSTISRSWTGHFSKGLHKLEERHDQYEHGFIAQVWSLHQM